MDLPSLSSIRIEKLNLEMADSHCAPCANVMNVTASVTVTDCENDVAFLTRELTALMAPRIRDILGAIHRTSQSIAGFPSLVDMRHETAEDAAYYRLGVEDDEGRAFACSAQQLDRESVELVETVLALCRPTEESMSRTWKKDDVESEASAAIIRILLKLDMDYAASCLRRYLRAWQRTDEESLLFVSDFTSGVEESGLRSHRTVLEESFESMVDNLSVSEALISTLLRKSVISDQMAYLILGRPNRKQQVVQLIQLLIQLGPYALKVFIEALRSTGYVPLANILAWNLRHGPRVTRSSDKED